METGSVTKWKADQVPSVLTEDRVDDIRHRMDVSPNKAVRKLALQKVKPLASKRKLKSQQSLFTKIAAEEEAAIHANYHVAFEIAKQF
ncbi:hypothetical protein Trydic_g15036 [Trypoxylus dichotomus]